MPLPNIRTYYDPRTRSEYYPTRGLTRAEEGRSIPIDYQVQKNRFVPWRQEMEGLDTAASTLPDVTRTASYRAWDERASKRHGIKPLSEIRKDRPVWEAIWNPNMRMSGSDITGDPYTGAALELFDDPVNLVAGFGALKAMKLRALAKARNVKSAKLLATGGMPEEVFEKTLVKEPVYHGTFSDFPKFDLPETDVGIHFGTPEQASARIAARGRATKKLRDIDPEGPPYDFTGANVRQHLIDVQRPLRTPDTYGLDPDAIYGSLVEENRLVPPSWDVQEALLRYQHAPVLKLRKSRTSAYRAIEDHLRRSGYDSLMYANTVEGPGQKSFAILNPEQAYAPWVAPRPVPVPPGAPPWLGGAAAYQARSRRE